MVHEDCEHREAKPKGRAAGYRGFRQRMEASENRRERAVGKADGAQEPEWTQSP
jgi:hypothetical protein